MIKNIIICALAVTCALLTIRLWFGNFLIHGLFPGEPVVAASPAHQRMAGGMVETGKMAVSLDDGGERYEMVYSSLSAHLAWGISARALSALIDEGSFDHSGTLDEAAKVQIFSHNNIVIQYNFSMPTGFFREQFGQRPGFLSSVFGSFETLVIAPRQGIINFFFVSGANGGEDGNGMFHVFTLDDSQIYDDVRYLFAQRAEEAEKGSPDYHIRRGLEFVPTWEDDFKIVWQNPIGEQMLHADVRPFVLFFFPNPAVASYGVTINGVYTYQDSVRVVKFYPNNIVEANALPNTRPSGTVSLGSSLLAALDMLDRDNPANDVILAGYSLGPAEGQWNFYFDYVAGGRPITISEIEGIVDTGALSHAVEIRVINNAVVQYRRLMLDFFEGI
jgi:hypothetical protein